jgi:MFS family permease
MAGNVIVAWGAALGATLLMQTVASFMTQSLPVLGPILTANFGLSPETIGNLSSLNAFGTVFFLAFGGPVLAKLGPVRMLQVGAALSGIGLLAVGIGTVPALVIAALLLGVGYGPMPPAGSRILAATAPSGHRTLIFSVKQAGAPAGGMLAGLVTAPVALAFGWQAALVVCAVTAAAASLAIQPLRPALDAERDSTRRIDPASLFSPATLAAPYRALGLSPELPLLTLLAVSFSLVQGCLFSFTVTWLVETRGLSLIAAGTAFAALQAAGVFARIALGWLADRTGRPSVNLTVQGFLAAGAVLLFAHLPLAAGPGMIAGAAALAGFFGASWNGIYLAEVARLVPREQVSEATSGSTLFTFLGYVAGPSLFAQGVRLSGGWNLPMDAIAIQLALVAALAMPRVLRPHPRDQRR